jgi:hypothetical protein
VGGAFHKEKKMLKAKGHHIAKQAAPRNRHHVMKVNAHKAGHLKINHHKKGQKKGSRKATILK